MWFWRVTLCRTHICYQFFDIIVTFHSPRDKLIVWDRSENRQLKTNNKNKLSSELEPVSVKKFSQKISIDCQLSHCTSADTIIPIATDAALIDWNCSSCRWGRLVHMIIWSSFHICKILNSSFRRHIIDLSTLTQVPRTETSSLTLFGAVSF